LSLGCASGEEVYSLAILLREYFPHEVFCTKIAIHASDIDTDILQAAEQAIYNEDRLQEIPAPIKDRYFFPNTTRMQLSEQIREMVSFHQHNIMDVELFGPCHLILCRNTLIYFTRQDQEIILRGIARILHSGGVLVLGKSETMVGEARRLFTTICPVERIYRRI
jgi:chemotaxis protein methyltransferase CheR